MKNTIFLKFERGGGVAVMSTFAESTKIFDGTKITTYFLENYAIRFLITPFFGNPL